jgi:hypothetical protein
LFQVGFCGQHFKSQALTVEASQDLALCYVVTFFNKQFDDLARNPRYDGGIGIGGDRGCCLVDGINICAERLCNFDGNRSRSRNGCATSTGTGVAARIVSSLEVAASPTPQPDSRALPASDSVAMIDVVAFMVPDQLVWCCS